MPYWLKRKLLYIGYLLCIFSFCLLEQREDTKSVSTLKSVIGHELYGDPNAKHNYVLIRCDEYQTKGLHDVDYFYTWRYLFYNYKSN